MNSPVDLPRRPLTLEDVTPTFVSWGIGADGGKRMSKVGRTALALVAAAVVLVVMAWFDTTVVRDAIQQGRANFDSSQSTLIMSLGTVASAGAVLLLALLAWWSRSAAVGALYAAVGAYFAFQLWIWMNLAGTRNDTPPMLPHPLDSAVNHIHLATAGPLNAVGIIGGGMLVAGVAILTRSFRERIGSSVPR